jgi:hypothetical protein
MSGTLQTSWARTTVLLAICWIGLPATTTGQVPSEIIDLRNQVDKLESVLELLKHDLSESRSLHQQALDLRNEIEQADHEKEAREVRLKERQQLLETLGVWSSADLVLGDRNTSRVVALCRSTEGWTVTSIATRPFQQYALAAADRAGVPCRADAHTEAQLKEVLDAQPPGPFAPFTIRGDLLVPASPPAPPAEQPKPATLDPTPPQPTPPANPSAVYQLILLPLKRGDPPQILGTAFAVNPHFLVTSGTLLLGALPDPKKVVPRLAIRFNPQTNEIRVADFMIHPRFCDEARKQAKQRAELMARKHRSRQDNVNLATLDRSLAVFDMGLLLVEEDLPEFLEINLGLPLTDEAVQVRSWSPSSNPQHRLEHAAEDVAGRIVSLGADRPIQLLAPLLPRADWRGSPLIGRDGSVRGIYTSPMTMGEVAGQGWHFATSISQLTSLLESARPKQGL